MTNKNKLKKINANKKIKILIISSDESTFGTISNVLDEEGYTGEFVGDGKHALEKIKETFYNLVLLDIKLQDMDSIKLLRDIKKSCPDIIDIIMSGHDSIDILTTALKAGAYDYIDKPLQPTRLEITLRRGIQQQKLSDNNLLLVKNLKKKNQSLNKAVHELTYLNNNLQAVYIGITTTLAEILDAKDPQTRGHSDRVALYTGILAEEMKLSEKEIKAIKQASQLHDIGKIGVRDQVLGKTSRLDENEWLQIQLHSERGKDLLSPLQFLMNDVIPLVWYHHERYDGKGYPDGLKGESIPLGARIILVADTFDAMICDRPYRKAKTVEEALTELVWGKETQFDPKVVDAFLKVMEKGRFEDIIAMREVLVEAEM